MIFSSDNWSGAHPAIGENLMAHAGGYASGYGTSDLDRKVEQKFAEIFERNVAVFFVGTGTAANSLALATTSRAGGVAFCHGEAHVIADECGAPGFFSHGARLKPVDGPRGKMVAACLEAEIRRFPLDNVQGGQPTAVSLTQATESGTVYSLAEIDAIAAVSKAHWLAAPAMASALALALVAWPLTLLLTINPVLIRRLSACRASLTAPESRWAVSDCAGRPAGSDQELPRPVRHLVTGRPARSSSEPGAE